MKSGTFAGASNIFDRNRASYIGDIVRNIVVIEARDTNTRDRCSIPKVKRQKTGIHVGYVEEDRGCWKLRWLTAYKRTFEMFKLPHNSIGATRRYVLDGSTPVQLAKSYGDQEGRLRQGQCCTCSRHLEARCQHRPCDALCVNTVIVVSMSLMMLYFRCARFLATPSHGVKPWLRNSFAAR